MFVYPPDIFKEIVMNRVVFWGLALFVSGCASYTGLVTPGDDQVDEGNKPFAAKAAADYRQRQQFRRPVVIQEAEGIGMFLSPSYVPRSNDAQANALCRNLEVRRTMVQSAKAKLREIVSGLRDLQLTGEGEVPMVSVSSDSERLPSVYRITYNIANLDLQLKVNQFVTVNGRHPAEWTANASVEIRMIDPAGNAVFTFPAQGVVSQSDDGSMRPNATMLEEAVCAGVAKAMSQYAFKFGPPIYVVDTCQNGEYARISIGTDYGIKQGMRVEFIRHRNRQGFDGNVEIAEQRVGTGTVGYGDAPVEAKCAWVHVDDYDAKAPRSVFQWTSVKLLDKPNGGKGFLALPDLSTLSL